MAKNFYYIFLIICFSVCPVTIALSQPQTITLNNISKDTIEKFDCVHAITDKNVLITSIQNNAVIPNNYWYPIIEWQGPENYNDAFLIELKSNKNRLNVFLKKNRWQPEGNEFKKFLQDKELFISIYWMDKGKTYKSQPIRVVISNRSLNERIAFRIVQPLFLPDMPNAIKIFSFDQRSPNTLMELEGTCVGCHGYTANFAYFNLKKLDQRKLITLKQSGQQIQLNNQTIGLYSFFTLSRNGKYGAVVMNPAGDLVVKNTIIEPFDYPYRSGDIFSYDIEKNTFTPLKGASDPNFVEDMPFFSPDGKYLLFSRYQYSEKNGVQGVHAMDLYQVPFNNGNGGEPVPIKNASFNNLCQYFARYAPNGKWISFCRGEGLKGIYARKTSDIYLLSIDGNKVTKLNLNMDNMMDSWHEWSSDSHWLIFSSNREKNGITALYLVYIDDQGKDYPPVKLFGDEKLKVNTPQFIPKSLTFGSADSLRDYIQGIFLMPTKPRAF